jgi:glycosyltransferase involved in cell wall biosynthesis
MKIITTLTTIPSRLSYQDDQGIKLCIDSLINQSYENYEIHFNIPHICKLSQEEYIIPEWLEELANNNPKLKIFRTEDLGPATKLIPTIKRMDDLDTIIVVVDDDLVYHPDMISAHVENQTKWQDAIVGYDGLRSRNDDGQHSSFFGDSRDYYYTSQKHISKVDILQHYKSVSYKRAYFEDDFFEFSNNNLSWSDDLLLAAYFSYKKRDRIVETHESIPEIKSFDEWIQLGGVSTFPVLRHTHHESYEGCNVFRQTNVDDNGKLLYPFIDNGYIK